MKLALSFAWIVGFTAVVQATDNSVEVTLEDTLGDQQAQGKVLVLDVYLHKPPPQKTDSDADYGYWRNKFEGGSDKPLGTPKDTAAIRGLIPATISPTIRWVSRSIVVVSADCRPPPPYVLGGRCLYLFEKHGSKWSLTHYYRWPHQLFF
jgi:hypothetical protein